MMKRILSVLFFFPLLAGAQSLKPNETNATEKVVLETAPVLLKESGEMKMEASFVAEGPSLFLKMAGWGVGANTINSNELAILLLDNDSTVTVQSPVIQGFDYNAKTYVHKYAIRQEDLERLSRRTVQAVRKYSVLGFDDVYLNETERRNLQALCREFLQSLAKAHLLKAKPVPLAPAFPGGQPVWLAFINRNLTSLPALQDGEQRSAVVEFRVQADGSISNLQVKQSAGTVYDNELLRILKRMPRWKPALLEGTQVDYMVAQPIRFYQQNAAVRVRF